MVYGIVLPHATEITDEQLFRLLGPFSHYASRHWRWSKSSSAQKYSKVSFNSYITLFIFFVCVQPKGWSLKRKFWSKHHFRCELWCGKLSVQLGVNKSKHKGTGRFKTTMHISETLHFDILDMKLNRTVIYIYCILYLALLFHGFLLETWRPPP